MDGPQGFEHNLLSAFVTRLGADLEIEITGSLASVFPRSEIDDAEHHRLKSPPQAAPANLHYRIDTDRLSA